MPPRFPFLTAALLAALVAGCGYNVQVGKYEEHGPTVTHHPDGAVSATADASRSKSRSV